MQPSLFSAAAQILPTTSSFDAVLYLALVHGETEVDDLRSGCANLHMELSERTGQLKALVSWVTPVLKAHGCQSACWAAGMQRPVEDRGQPGMSPRAGEREL